MNLLYSAKEFKLPCSGIISGELQIEEHPELNSNDINQRIITFGYTINKRQDGSDIVIIGEAIKDFQSRGKTLPTLGFEAQPLEASQVLNIILSYGANLDKKFVNLGRRFFQPDQEDRVEKIGSGKYLWKGSFESVRCGWKLRLNVDMANKPAYERGMLDNILVHVQTSSL